jgi:hypothetical protein
LQKSIRGALKNAVAYILATSPESDRRAVEFLHHANLIVQSVGNWHKNFQALQNAAKDARLKCEKVRTALHTAGIPNRLAAEGEQLIVFRFPTGAWA